MITIYLGTNRILSKLQSHPTLEIQMNYVSWPGQSISLPHHCIVLKNNKCRVINTLALIGQSIATIELKTMFTIALFGP